MTNAALFIDFDNVLYNLRQFAPEAAARFTHRPINLLDALAGTERDDRRLVSRRCYASPHLINPFRRNFTHGGFEVVDTPPLTMNAKNGADILIVMDILDWLVRHPHIDEFIILSGDADFAPLLNRLRRENKQTAIFAPANIAGAYRNSADRVLDVDWFVEAMRGSEAPRRTGKTGVETAKVAPDAPPSKAAKLSAEVAATVETLLLSVSQQRMGTLDFPLVGNTLLSRAPEIVGQKWAGYGTLSQFLHAITLKHFDIDFAAQKVRERDFRLRLDDWGREADDALCQFVTDIFDASGRKLPVAPPPTYSFIFSALAHLYGGGEVGDFSEAIEHVVESAEADGRPLPRSLVRFVAIGLLARGYALDRNATPALIARLWRLNVYELCGRPEWLEDEHDALRLATWFKASDESIQDAAAGFLADIHQDAAVTPPREPELDCAAA